jgi:RimJ/RimL family protein N-acetyltransferase
MDLRSYFLTSKRLGFSTWSPADTALALGLWGDPEVSRFTGGPFTEAEVLARLSREIETLQQHQVQYWPLYLLESGEHVGCCGLRPRTDVHEIYDMGFQLRRVHWGAGFAREAAATVIAHAFTALGARALCAGHHPANEASRHVLQSLGFRYSHDQFYAPTQMIEPYYRLDRP